MVVEVFFVLPEDYGELYDFIEELCKKTGAPPTFPGRTKRTTKDDMAFSDFTVFIVNAKNIESCINDVLFAVEIRKRILVFVEKSIDVDSLPIKIRKQSNYIFSSINQLKKILMEILPERIDYIRTPEKYADLFDEEPINKIQQNYESIIENKPIFEKINAPAKIQRQKHEKNQIEELDGAGSLYISNDTWTNHDRLNREVLVKAIFKFLTHSKTKAPLAISIQAPWGAGKTSLMKMIQEKLDITGFKNNPETPYRDVVNLKLDEILNEIEKDNPEPLNYHMNPNDKFTIWFNAWKYENTEQVWAGLADAIIRQITGRLDDNERTKFWIRINKEQLKKLNIRKTIKNKIIREWTKKIVKWVVIVIAGATSSSLAFYLQSPVIGSFGFLASFISGGLIVSKEYLLTLEEVKTDAVQNTYEQFLKIPNYEDKLGLAHTVEQDIKNVLKKVPKEHLPLIVFIDDLDRCPPSRVAEITEAINRFISASIRDCIFIIGMDNELVATSLEAAYPEISSKLSNQYTAQTLGWKFMDKFIQLPITVPSPQSGSWSNYLESILEKKEEKKPKQESNEITDQKTTQTTTTESPPAPNAIDNILTPEKIVEFTPQEDKELDAILGDDEKIKEYCTQLVNDFTSNPREVKRIVNVLRFQTVLREARRIKHIKSPSTDALLAWTILSLKWPAVESWITRGAWETSSASEKNIDTRKISQRLYLLHKYALEPSTWEQNLKKLLLLDNDKHPWTVAPWILDEQLRIFFAKHRLSESEGTGLY